MKMPLVMEPVAHDIAKMSYILRNPEKYHLRLDDVGVSPEEMNGLVRQRLYALGGLKDLWDDDSPKLERLKEAWRRVFGAPDARERAGVFREIESINLWPLVESLADPRKRGLDPSLSAKDPSEIPGQVKRAVVNLSYTLLPDGLIDDEAFVSDLFATARQMASDRVADPAAPRLKSGRAV